MNRKTLINKLASSIIAIEQNHPVRVGIDGVDASGKTSLADELAESLLDCRREIIRVSVDGFHNPRSVRYQRGRDSAEGYYRDSFDNQRVVDVLLAPLGVGGDLKYKTAVFDYKTDSEVTSSVQEATRDAILIVDGVFLFRPELLNYWDFKVFVDVDFETTVDRAIQREIVIDSTWKGREVELRDRYHQRYVAGQELYFNEAQPMEKADVVVGNGDFENPTISFRKSRK